MGKEARAREIPVEVFTPAEQALLLELLSKCSVSPTQAEADETFARIRAIVKKLQAGLPPLPGS